MHLEQAEIEQFYKLWYALVWGINEKHRVIPHFEKPVYGTRIAVSQRDFMAIRDKMWEKPKWIDEFLALHDNGEFAEKERAIIISWRKNYVCGKFVIMRHLKNYSVFMQIGEDEKEPIKLYGVCGISDSFKDICQGDTFIMAEAVLIPFKDRIIYDSFLVSQNISFGPGIRETFNTDYKKAKDGFGIITML